MKITFVVEKITDLIYNKDDEGLTSEFVCATPNCYHADKKEFGWKYHNKREIADLVNFGYANLLTKEMYSHSQNSFYLICISQKYDLEEQFFWNYMSSDTIDFLKRTNIPILLYYASEGVGFTDYKYYIKMIEKRNELGLTNKFVLFSLSNFVDILGKKISLSELDPILEDFKWVPSLSFLIRYACKTTLSDSTIEHWINNSYIIKEHDYAAKKFNFVCLNNLPSYNRILLLKVLYHNKELWDNNIISNRNTYPENKPSFNSTLMKIIHKEKDYVDEKYRFGKIISNNMDQFLATSGFSELVIFIRKLTTWSECPTTLIDDITLQLNDRFNLSWFKDCVFSLVTETYQWHEANKFLNFPMVTEKSIKPIVQRQPFLIFGYPNNHKLLNDLGFKTYEELLGFPKDGDIGNLTTVERLYNITKGLYNFDKTKLNVGLLKEYADFNYNHLVNTDWRRLQCDLLTYSQF